jgi:predicted ATPase
VIQGLRDTSPQLVGRQREFSLLQSGLEAALGGRVGVALVSGEPGIGKTRLLRDFAERATEQGALVLLGGASEAEGMPPYLPFLEALGRYVQSAPLEVLRQQIGPLGGPLAELLPELSARLGELPSGYALPSQQARVRLYEAVGDFLAAVAEHAPLVLILDDLQWADSATLDLLCYVARHQPTARLLVLGAYREGEAAANAALERSLVELNRLRVLLLVPLRPLGADDLGAIGTRELGGPLDSHLVSALHRHSEGNAFFAEELLRDWVESGAIVSLEGTFSFAPQLATSLPASAGVWRASHPRWSTFCAPRRSSGAPSTSRSLRRSRARMPTRSRSGLSPRLVPGSWVRMVPAASGSPTTKCVNVSTPK